MFHLLLHFSTLFNTSSTTTSPNGHDYLQWLDLQPKGSVLYVSMGSFLSVSAAQMDEIVAGVKDSGVRYLWVSRGDSSRFEDSCGDQGLVIPWCDQLRVLCYAILLLEYFGRIVGGIPLLRLCMLDADLSHTLGSNSE
ncbi:hypothetical protein V6N13_119521 [Hibiscus sabdariffa]